MLKRCVAVGFRLSVRSRLSPALIRKCQLVPPPSLVSSVPIRLYSNTWRLRAANSTSKSASGSSSTRKKASTAKKTTPSKKKKQASATKAAKSRKPTLTPEQKEREKAKKEAQKQREEKTQEKEKVKQLKQDALEPPRHATISAYQAFTRHRFEELGPVGQGSSPKEVQARFAQRGRDNGAAFKGLGAAEVEHWNHVANEQNAAAAARYKGWVESHSPEQIRIANKARKALRRMYSIKRRMGAKWPEIHDERQLSRVLSGYLRFSIERHASGDFTNIKAPDRMRLIAAEWGKLDDSEKQKYRSIYTREVDRWRSDFEDTYGHVPVPARTGTASAAA